MTAVGVATRRDDVRIARCSVIRGSSCNQSRRRDDSKAALPAHDSPESQPILHKRVGVLNLRCNPSSLPCTSLGTPSNETCLMLAVNSACILGILLHYYTGGLLSYDTRAVPLRTSHMLLDGAHGAGRAGFLCCFFVVLPHSGTGSREQRIRTRLEAEHGSSCTTATAEASFG